MKRKYYFLIIMLLSIIYFTGSQPPEIADRIMVHAIGIDAEEALYRSTERYIDDFEKTKINP